MNTILGWDEKMLLWLNTGQSVFWDHWIWILTNGLTWIPLYMAIVWVIIEKMDSMQEIGLAIGGGILCVLLADLMADGIVKPWVSRYRPSHNPILKYVVHIVRGERGGLYGFFSAHAANTMALASFFSLIFRNKIISAILILWSLLNCYTRMYLGLHYPLDIFVGLLWGVIVGCAVYKGLYERLALRLVKDEILLSDREIRSACRWQSGHIIANVFSLTLAVTAIIGLLL